MSKLIIEKRYATTPNAILNEPLLSLKAKGMFAYLQSKPENWKFSVNRMANELMEGKQSIQNALKELENYGLLCRIAQKNERGKWIGFDYVLSETPFTENPSTVNPLTGNPATLNKQYNNKQEIIKNITSIATDKSVAENEQKNEINWKTTARPFSFSEKIKSMEQSTDRRMPIISAYWITKKMVFDNNEQYSTALRRELRPAGDIIGWELSKIKETIKWLNENADFKWTLETVLKYITENLKNLENKKLPYDEQQRLLAEEKRAYYASLDRQ